MHQRFLVRRKITKKKKKKRDDGSEREDFEKGEWKGGRLNEIKERKRIYARHEGKDIKESKPVCERDFNTNGIQFE